MRVFTYPDPFSINSNSELWDIVTSHPHFCASDTLVQGLEAEYGRTNFGILRTINTLIDCIMHDYTQNPQNDISVFLATSEAIREISDPTMRSAFRFNIADVVKSVKLLAMLECDPSKFEKTISVEQELILEIYSKVLNRGLFAPLEQIKQISKESLIDAIRLTLNAEVEYLCDRNPEYLSLGITLPLTTAESANLAIQKIIEHLKEKNSTAPKNLFSKATGTSDLNRALYIQSLLKSKDTFSDTVIIHGVHRITPEMYFLFQLLDRCQINIIFLINYASNLPAVYNTWKEVYQWCGATFEYENELDLATSGNIIGAILAQIIEGTPLNKLTAESVTRFENLTSFTDREVRKKFKKAKEKTTLGASNPLNRMDTQYYAVQGDSSNEILKMYFPEQFKQKPFLSYPIGQFILGIYEMWDTETGEVHLNANTLAECAVSNLYNATTNLLEFINRTKLYFADIKTPKEYLQRIEQLSDTLALIEHNSTYKPLKKLAYFNITPSGLKEFSDFICFIDEVSTKLFENENTSIDFAKHFQRLMEIISTPALEGATLSHTEQTLINEITTKLSTCTDGSITGHIQDVKEALCFYLAESKKGDTSNWIVRDFEQIDGGVLLRKISKARSYHFALLSNEHMTLQHDKILPWPLSAKMFSTYTDLNSALPAITTGILQRRSFLKFSFFYGLFFTKCSIKLSFISEENGEKQEPYYMLDILNLSINSFQENEIGSFEIDTPTPHAEVSFSSSQTDESAQELFAICPYKFLLHSVLKAPIEYSNDYQTKYFVSNFLSTLIQKNHRPTMQNIDAILKTELKSLQPLFPFWNELVFTDIKNSVLQQFASNSDVTYQSSQTNVYIRRKENFLIAQWVDVKTKERYMDFNPPDLSELMTKYMTNHTLYPSLDKLPHEKVCENCNYSDVCLHNHYNSLTNFNGARLL